MKITLVPITLRQACKYVSDHHRHHPNPPRGWKFGVGAEVLNKLVGVVIVGRPVSRVLDDGKTLEVLRLVSDGTEKNVCSFLYAAAARASKSLGYTRLITYTLSSENGASLKASGWIPTHKTIGRSWDCPSRPRKDKSAIEDKVCWTHPGMK